MEKIIKARIEYLKKKIEEYDNILKNKDNLDEETRKKIQAIKIKVILRIALLTSIISTLMLKAVGMGFPIIKDDRQGYRYIRTTISEDGNIKDEIVDENYLLGLELLDFELSDKVFSNYLYNYSDWEKVVSEVYISDSYIRYVETYDLEERTAEEIAELLKQEDLDLKEILGEPINVCAEINPSADVLSEEAYLEAKKSSRYSFSEKESNRINIACTLGWLIFAAWLLKIFYNMWSHDFGNSERLQEKIKGKYVKRKNKWEKELKEASLKLERKKKNDNKEL